MNKYELLCEELNEYLGNEYDIKYFENEENSWEDILKDTSEMVHGVMHIIGGQTSYIGEEPVVFEQLQIQLMIPLENNEFFYNQIANLEKLKYINEHTLDAEGELFVFSYQNRSDASRNPVNGIEYGLITINCSIVVLSNLILSKTRKVYIDDIELKGIINCTYVSSHSLDGVVSKTSPFQRNTCNGINITLDIDLVWFGNNELHLKLMLEADSIKEYNVRYFNGLIERSYKMQIAAISENSMQNEKLQGKITFALGGVK